MGLLVTVNQILGAPSSDIANQAIQLGNYVVGQGESMLLAFAAQTHNDPAVLAVIANRTFGDLEENLANAVSIGALTPSGAVAILDGELGLLRQAGTGGGATLLPGEAQFDYMIAKLQDDAGPGSALSNYLIATYGGHALPTGQALMPFVDTIGSAWVGAALQTGQQAPGAAALDAPIAGAKAAGVSADEIVSVAALGHSMSQNALVGDVGGGVLEQALLQYSAATGNDPAVIQTVADRFVNGWVPPNAPADWIGGNAAFPGSLVQLVGAGVADPSRALQVIDSGLQLLQSNLPSSVLPGPAQAEILLAQVQNEAEKLGVTAFDAVFAQDYALALSIGQAMLPLIGDLGQSLSSYVLQQGASLITAANIDNPDAQAQIVQNLMSAPAAANVSTDEVLTLAAFSSGGVSQQLNMVMTSRLLGGAAEAELTGLVMAGMGGRHAVSILAAEVQALAANNAGGGALGFDQATATGFVTAQLALDLATVQQPETARETADPGNASAHAANANRAGAVLTELEQTQQGAIVVGLGVITGLLQSSQTTPASQAQAALVAAILNAVLPASILNSCLTNAPDSSDALLAIAQTQVQAFQNADQRGADLESFLDQWTKVNGEITYIDPEHPDTESVTGNIVSHDFLADAHDSASATAMVQNAWGLAGANASASASATVSSYQLEVNATSGALAEVAANLGGHGEMEAFVQALATGDIQFGVTGLSVSAYAGVTSGVSLGQTESFSASGLSGAQTTTLEADVVAAANGSLQYGAQGLAASFGARVGGYVAAGEQATFVAGPVTTVVGATIVSPGALGLSVAPTVGFDDGNLEIGLNAFVGVGLFGVGVNFDVKISGADIVAFFEDNYQQMPSDALTALKMLGLSVPGLGNLLGFLGV